MFQIRDRRVAATRSIDRGLRGFCSARNPGISDQAVCRADAQESSKARIAKVRMLA